MSFTDDAVEKLVDELSQVRIEQADGESDVQRGIYVEPVQLQVVCRQLWDRQKPQPGACLTADEINVQGNVDDALASYYSDVVQRAAACPGVTERAVREWFDHRLILAHGIRGQALRSSIASDGLTADAVRVLEEGYLIRPEGRSGATWFELAHDRLVAPVRRDNAAWYAAHLSPLQKQAALWDQQDQPQNLLFAGTDLAAAVEWAANNQPLRLREERFLSASIEASRAQRQQRWSRINRRIAIVMTALFALALVATLAALYLYQVAENQSRIASVRALGRRGHEQSGRRSRTERSAVQASRAHDAAGWSGGVAGSADGTPASCPGVAHSTDRAGRAPGLESRSLQPGWRAHGKWWWERRAAYLGCARSRRATFSAPAR